MKKFERMYAKCNVQLHNICLLSVLKGAVRKDSVGGRSTSEGLRTSERPSHTPPTHLGHFPNENVGGNQHRYKTENGRSASSEMATKVTSQNFPGEPSLDIGAEIFQVVRY